jgi:hypothetical protein
MVKDRPYDRNCLAQTRERAGALPGDPVLVEHREVSNPAHDLSAPLRELVPCRGQLRDVRRVTQEDRRHARPQTDLPRARRYRGKDEPDVLVVDLIGAVTGLQPQRVRERDHLKQLVRRLFRQQLQAKTHRSVLPSLTTSHRAPATASHAPVACAHKQPAR